MAQALVALATVHLEGTRSADLGAFGDAVLMYCLGERRPRRVVGKFRSA